ncbi:MAG: hypothetical protein JSV05_08035 [Candidatus Bathyarchaeota archaeon]|nr:MAG: hypothetical protein JSV05_08035 [Candidatus Bathyarchaeota archaeon]
MPLNSFQLIKENFSKYYHTLGEDAFLLSLIRQREFGFILFDKKIMLRHKSFKSSEALKGFLISLAPSDAYFSAAFYERPTASMTKKGWQGADLVFDIDADHIPTPCNKRHDKWICSKCGSTDNGPSPKKCPNCREEKFETQTWICDDCLESAKTETIKLIEILEDDFGVMKSEISAFFSGHRGYHIHIENERVGSLNSMARKEIVDYVMGVGFKKQFHKLARNRRKEAKIDTVVTMDIHRLIRLVGSLHGKTGFIKTKASLVNLDKFDPLKEAIAFKKGEIVVNVTEAPEFRIGDVTFGPFKNVYHEELPTAAALFLLCKGVAQVVE